MKKIKITVLFVAIMTMGLMAQTIAPYYNCGQVSGDIKTTKDKVKAALIAKGFKITGGYYVANKSSMYVLTYSSTDLRKVCLKVKERGIIATNLRVGFEKIGTKTEISMLNPKYMFIGYLRDSYYTNQTVLDKVSKSAKEAVKSVGGKLSAFGGTLKEKDLKKYHYMAMMPYFDDPVELEEFSSFAEATATIEKNLKAKKGNTKRVYSLKYDKSQKAVYGVALLDKEEGEAHFLGKIGTKHFTAMPYEIVVEGNKVTMLHGKFRFAMYWPELTMGQFTKIMSTPGNVEDILEGLTEK
jgi:hypothetical protein